MRSKVFTFHSGVFDTNVDAAVRYRATKVRMWSDSDYDYTETSQFYGSPGWKYWF